MVKSEPSGSTRAVALDFAYDVSDYYIESQLDEQGVQVPKRWGISFNLTDLGEAEQRRRARKLHRLYSETPGYPEIEAPTDDPVEFMGRLEPWVEQGRIERERLAEDQLEQGQREFQSHLDFAEQMAAWIELQGSERLRLAHSREYKVSGTYARERARVELPGFWVDTAGGAEWRERVDPTAGALRAETAVRERIAAQDWPLSTRIVWLVEPPSDLEGALGEAGFEFEQQEALLVDSYLGRYPAIMPIEPDYRAPSESDREPGERNSRGSADADGAGASRAQPSATAA